MWLGETQPAGMSLKLKAVVRTGNHSRLCSYLALRCTVVVPAEFLAILDRFDSEDHVRKAPVYGNVRIHAIGLAGMRDA
eukprot:scaffold1875_cov339-Prasinococcus_capsulatus_cf.AAC.9